MKYKLVGIDRDTKSPIEMIVEAADAAEAERIAQSKGIVITSLAPPFVDAPTPTPTPQKPATSIGPPPIDPPADHGWSKQRIAVTSAAAVGIIATFLPWARVPLLGSVQGMETDEGWITLALFMATIIVAVTGDRTLMLYAGRRLAAVIPSIVAGVIGAWKIIDFHIEKSRIGADNPFGELVFFDVKIGVGLYLVVVAAMAAWVLAFALRD